jgi:NADH dehydrogenase [ubiquinone] 1 alpha subcomplex assembly factor 7
LPVGSRIEVSHAAFKVARNVGEVFGSGEASRGSALIVDYGGDQAYGDSFRVSSGLFNFDTALIWYYQAFKGHKIVDVFHRPGECDLTANVDFAYLKEAFAGLGAHQPCSRQPFLCCMTKLTYSQSSNTSRPTTPV